MKTIWRKLTQHSGDPSDDIPWWAIPVTLAFVTGAYALVQTLDAAGF